MNLITERQITMLFANAKINQVMFIAFGLFIIAIVGLILTETIWAKHASKATAPMITATILLAVIILTGATAGSTLSMKKTAEKRGYSEKNDPRVKSMTIAEVWDGIDHAMEESELPDDLSGKIVIYQKFGCPDCRAIFDDLTSAFAGRDDVYWVSTRSDTGIKLREQYPVNDVPAGLYIKDEKAFAELKLYTKVGDKTILDERNLQELLSYVQN